MKKSLPVIIILVIIGLRANCQLINTIAGTGTASYNGDSIAAVTAELNNPVGIALDRSGNVYITEYGSYRVRKITKSTGIITTIAGTGVSGYNGDNIPADTAKLTRVTGVAVDSVGNVYIADGDNNRVRKVDHTTGFISTIAGTDSVGYNGDGILADTARLNRPTGLAIGASGNIYIADESNNRIRKITVSTGMISTIAGTARQGYNGDNITADTAELFDPFGIALDDAENVYIGDTYNNRIRKITVSTGMISTIAGTGTAGYNGDGIDATAAELNQPVAVAYDKSGFLYIADSYNSSRIRKVTFESGMITTIAGTGTGGYNGDGILATTAELYFPYGVAVDSSGNVFIADEANNRIREVDNSPAGIIENNVKGVGVFPNPNNGNFTLAYRLLSPNGKLQISDITGRMVYTSVLSASEGTKQINASFLSKGLYYWQVVSGKDILENGKVAVVK